MRIALYQGVSFISRLIRWQTRSRYSHAAWLCDDGSVIEAWQPRVREVASLSSQHTPGTVVDIFNFASPLTRSEDKALYIRARSYIGRPYSYRGVLRFLTRVPDRLERRIFCSEMVFQNCLDCGIRLLARTEAWRVPPDWISRSTALWLQESVVTT